MDQWKLMSWNIEWSDKLLSAVQSGSASEKSRAERRLAAIGHEIAIIDPDIAVITEGPQGEARAADFFARVAPDHDVVLRNDGQGKSYAIRGIQWIWFLVRKGLPAQFGLLHVDRWRQNTNEASFGTHGSRWMVGMPTFIQDGSALAFDPEKPHTHYRHPQVLQVTLDGAAFEIIGGHLKSKFINLATPAGIGQPGTFKANPEFVAAVIEARVKLSSECTDIRYYLEQRFTEDVDAPIIVAGDFNDGPGKELIEEQFLLHDLIGNLQGDVFFARRFLNHALFDFQDEERWTVQFEDKLDPRRPKEILLDHILFSQSFVGADRPGAFDYRAGPGRGIVEHAAHHAANAGLPQSSTTSDHRPVSMVFVKR